MKSGIHPELHEITVTCTCGNVINTRSTDPNVKSTVCSACHPFFTGQQKFVDTEGRIERFKRRYAKKD